MAEKKKEDIYSIMFQAGEALEGLFVRFVPEMPRGVSVQRAMGQGFLSELYVRHNGVRIIGVGNGLPAEFMNDPDFIAYCKDAIKKIKGCGSLAALLAQIATKI